MTGANKGIGLETVRQLAGSGVTVLLTARNEKRGTEAVSLLHGLGLSNVLYHQLDVQDPQSIQDLANFIQSQFGRLDILASKHLFLSITRLFSSFIFFFLNICLF